MICPLTFRVVTALVRLLDETEFDGRQDYGECAKSERQDTSFTTSTFCVTGFTATTRVPNDRRPS